MDSILGSDDDQICGTGIDEKKSRKRMVKPKKAVLPKAPKMKEVDYDNIATVIKMLHKNSLIDVLQECEDSVIQLPSLLIGKLRELCMDHCTQATDSSFRLLLQQALRDQIKVKHHRAQELHNSKLAAIAKAAEIKQMERDMFIWMRRIWQLDCLIPLSLMGIYRTEATFNTRWSVHVRCKITGTPIMIEEKKMVTVRKREKKIVHNIYQVPLKIVLPKVTTNDTEIKDIKQTPSLFVSEEEDKPITHSYHSSLISMSKAKSRKFERRNLCLIEVQRIVNVFDELYAPGKELVMPIQHDKWEKYDSWKEVNNEEEKTEAKVDIFPFINTKKREIMLAFGAWLGLQHSTNPLCTFHTHFFKHPLFTPNLFTLIGSFCF